MLHDTRRAPVRRLITGVRALGVFEPVFLVLGVEMPARRLEVGTGADPFLMKVNPVLSGREVLNVEVDLYAVLGGDQSRGADLLALGVVNLDQDGLGGGGLSGRGQQTSEQEKGTEGGGATQ